MVKTFWSKEAVILKGRFSGILNLMLYLCIYHLYLFPKAYICISLKHFFSGKSQKISYFKLINVFFIAGTEIQAVGSVNLDNDSWLGN